MTRHEQAAALRAIRRESAKHRDILPAGRRVALEREALAEIVNVLTGNRYLEAWKQRED
jgi:hypothetical protein